MSGKEQEKFSASDIPIAPVQMTAAADLDDELHPDTESKLKRLAVVAIAITLFFVVLTVIFVLPRHIRTESLDVESARAPTGATATVEEGPGISAAKVYAPPEDAELRHHNQAQLEEALALVSQLKTYNVEEWAAADFESGVGEITIGEKAYREQRYPATQSAYAKAIKILQAIADRTDEAVAQAVDKGSLGLASRDSAAAAKSFELALGIEPEHEAAQRGLARAQTLDEVLTLINEAEAHERLGELKEAVQHYREALSLDAEAPGAMSAIARIEQVQLDSEFRRLMSAGFAAFEAKRDGPAKTAFERARKIKPNAAAPSAALAQVEDRILAKKIAKHLRTALMLEQQEEWAESAKQYRLAVRLDADLDGAGASAKRADARAVLDRQLRSFIGQPHRLGDDAVHAQAQRILGRARSIADPGPHLSRQIKQLGHAIEVARTPIAITLLSDNATEVTLYKIGRLGRFERHALAVIPGSYVVVGRRDGFRDVRVEFEVSPAHRDAMITVRCEEKLAFGS